MPQSTSKGYPYVLPQDHPKEYPAVSQQLAEAIDAGIVNSMAGALSTTKTPTQNAVAAYVAARAGDSAAYTPVWDQDNGTALAVGTGTLTGRYARAGILGWASIALVRNTGTNVGTAGQGYRFTLPGALPTVDYRSIQGTGVIVVAGVPIPVTVQAINGTQVRLVRPKDETRIGASTGAWASDGVDSIAFTMTYRVAPVT